MTSTGDPRCFATSLGEGQAILCTYPIEHMAAVSAAVNPDATAVLYAALAADGGRCTRSAASTRRTSSLERWTAPTVRGYVWLVNMADDVVETVASGASLVTLDGDAASSVTLSPFGVEVLRRA